MTKQKSISDRGLQALGIEAQQYAVHYWPLWDKELLFVPFVPFQSVDCVVVTNVRKWNGIFKKLGPCFICLRRSHIAKDCNSKRGCPNCTQRHHPSSCMANDTPVSGKSAPGVTQQHLKELNNHVQPLTCMLTPRHRFCCKPASP